MPRLVPFPVGLKITNRAPLSGPRTVGSGGTESSTGYIQTSASPFGLWRWQFTFTPMHKTEARRYRGFVTSLHGGANATRVTFRDPDGLSFADAGITPPTQAQLNNGVNWSNGQPWSNGKGWKAAMPLVNVAAAAAKGANVVAIAQTAWGAALGIGDMVGFSPFYFGMHTITEVIGGGQYRVWPPLRAALTTDHKATLTPVMVMRLEGEGSAPVSRGISVMEAPTITLLEVEDADVRKYFVG